jgi:hypothetical protein
MALISFSAKHAHRNDEPRLSRGIYRQIRLNPRIFQHHYWSRETGTQEAERPARSTSGNRE